ncbi:MAG: HugZ family protein [Sedimentitalea sp.]
MTSPVRPANDEARTLARGLLTSANSAVLGVLDRNTPLLSRIAFGRGPEGHAISLISNLSRHTKALLQVPACSLLLGEPGDKGDPLTHPRLTLQARASLIPHNDAIYEKMAAHYLRDHPKAKLYIGFADFNFVRFDAEIGHLNAGFGKAFDLTPAGMGLPSTP